ncbi:hypothetical protein FB451DRAFT_1535053 [Mycena latifolia]|nr:hypothetical protein FB451DRAFT_1535053 [Mycena latifolia]
MSTATSTTTEDVPMPTDATSTLPSPVPSTPSRVAALLVLPTKSKPDPKELKPNAHSYPIKTTATALLSRSNSASGAPPPRATTSHPPRRPPRRAPQGRYFAVVLPILLFKSNNDPPITTGFQLPRSSQTDLLTVDSLKKGVDPDGSVIDLIFDVHKYLDYDNSGTNAYAFRSHIRGRTATAAGNFDVSYVLSEIPAGSGTSWTDASLVTECMAPKAGAQRGSTS